MKAEEMVRVIKNQFFFLFGNPGVLIFSSHIFPVSFFPEELWALWICKAQRPLPSLREPFSFEVLRSHLSHLPGLLLGDC